MNRFALTLATCAIVSIVGVAALATADVLPAYCDVAGSACSNAGGGLAGAGDLPGLCTATTCTHTSWGGPGTSAATSSWACLVCEQAGVPAGSISSGTSSYGSGGTTGYGSSGTSGPRSSRTASGSGTGSSHGTVHAGEDAGATTDSGTRSSGCAASPVGATVAGGALFLGLGALAVMGARRRRR